MTTKTIPPSRPGKRQDEEQKVLVSVRLPANLRDLLAELSQSTGVPQSRLVGAAIELLANKPEMAQLVKASKAVGL